MKDLFNFEMSGEIKQYLKAQVFGDIFVDVRVIFQPMIPATSDVDKMALDAVNARLRLISGEISHVVREVIKDKLSEATPPLQSKTKEAK